MFSIHLGMNSTIQAMFYVWSANLDNFYFLEGGYFSNRSSYVNAQAFGAGRELITTCGW